jgi:MFS family permease
VTEDFVNINAGRAAAAGIAGTIVMTVLGLWIAPLMGIPPMNPAEMLAGALGGVAALGWAMHFMIGIILAVIYAVVAPRIPGPPAVRGAIYGLAPFLVAQLLVMPMMGMPVFSGSAPLALGSLLGHLVYGAVVGGVYGPVPAPSRREAELRSATTR